MAKSKWEKLSQYIAMMLQGIQKYIQEIDRQADQYNLLQMHFQANVMHSNKDMEYSKYIQMAKTFALFFSIFSNTNLKKELEKPFLAYPMIYQPLTSTSKKSSNQRKTVKIWSVSIKPAKKIIFRLIHFPLEVILYCPSPKEYNDSQSWFKDDDNTLFLFDKLHALHHEACDEEKIFTQLAKRSDKYFEQFIKRQTLVANSKQVFHYKPLTDESIKMAFERTIICRKQRKTSGHTYDILTSWEELLHSFIFKEVDWSQDKQKASMLRMKAYVNKRNNETSLKSIEKVVGQIFLEKLKGETRCFDRYVIGKLILYFCQKFTQNPKDKKSGQIACILWALVWLSHEKGDLSFSIEEIICLSSKQIFLKKQTILINEKETKVSHGLIKLLSIPIGKGKRMRNCRLFPDINKRNLKESLKIAFKTLFPNQMLSISLDSFLIFPHQFEGCIMPASLLEKIRNPNAFAGKSGDLKGCFLKAFERSLT